MKSSTSQGAATASRAPFTVQACLELRACPGLVAQVAGEVAQRPAELAAAHLAGDPQPLDHTVPGRVGEPVLEPIQAVAEPPGHLIVEGELVERLAQGLRAAGAQSGQRIRQGQSARTAEARLSTASGHTSASSRWRRRARPATIATGR